MTALAFDPDDSRSVPDTTGLDAATLLLAVTNDELRRLHAAIDALEATFDAAATRTEEPRGLG